SQFGQSDVERSNVIIYGAGEAGMITKKTLDRDRGMKYKVTAFIDDNRSLVNKSLEGVNIYPSVRFEKIIKDGSIDLFIISGVEISGEKKQELVDICLKQDVKVLNVPPMNKWINGELSFRQIKKIKIEDLLGRESIKLDVEAINKQLFDKTILITGAAGSIGSELVRQIIPFKPRKLILLDKAETPLYELELELRDKIRFSDFEVVVGDIRSRERMENLFKTFNPEIIYHAAAYKHVPMMESNPSEAIYNNILGTKNLVDLAVLFEVKNFVFVSTDKAVNPTSVMGASKRIAEIYVQSLNHKLHSGFDKQVTRFITTRFGNVLGSSGSVIQLFRKQIESGSPITVTHPEVTRYFMTIPEACQLVLEAGAMGNGGEIYIFDMGESVKIVDLAKKMIKLSGLSLGQDIQIIFTGLRPGEKLYEELLSYEENTIPTHHPKILIAKVREYEFDSISTDIKELIRMFDKQKNFEIVGKMKKIVPEYISQNSIYQSLDQKGNGADAEIKEP
ncbi:MAG: polysaccharide biosynthesis protein, partial [Bacteroidetes bacterium]|nr:polysaccharide biosynthesis protein [Bacteroidota bacterium]